MEDICSITSHVRHQWGHANNTRSQSISRVLSWTIIYLGYLLPNTSSSLPELSADHTIEFLFGLAPSGVSIAIIVTNYAVRSYRTFSHLLNKNAKRFIFCCTFRRLPPPRCYLALCPMEPGLSSYISMQAIV